MNEYFFGSGGGRIKATAAREIDRIARKHGATFVAASMPEGPHYWFATENRGNPFNEAVRDAVYADLEAAGLRDRNGLAEKCKAVRT